MACRVRGLGTTVSQCTLGGLGTTVSQRDAPWTLALAVALALMPAAAAADPPVAVEVQRLREEHARTLDAHGWDRRLPNVIAAENDLTQRALDLAAQSRDGAPTELDLLLETLGGDALGPHLRTLPRPRVSLVAAYLRRHRDAGLLRALPPSAVHGSLADALARVGAPEAAALLRDAIATAGLWERETFCQHALRLPTASVSTLSRSLVSEMIPLSLDRVGPSCIGLLTRSPEGLRALGAHARTLPRADAETEYANELLLGLLLDARGRHTDAAALLARMLSPAAPNGWQLDAATGLSVIAPLLDGSDATVLRHVNTLTPLLGFSRWRATPLRLRLRDPSLVADATAMLSAQRVDREVVDASLLALSWMAPPHHGVAATREVFDALPGRLGVEVLPAQLDLWREGLRTADACATDACLGDLMAQGSDEAASRAAVLLGDRGIAALSPARAASVVRRVVLQTSPWLAGALTVTMRTCPPSLRGLATADEGALPDVRALRFDVYLQQLQVRCSE